MTTRQITEREVNEARVLTNLPDKPSQPSLYRGKAMTAEEIKEVFDRLPLLLVERYNELCQALADTSTGNALTFLPIITASDEGKVLAVEEGEWVTKELPKERIKLYTPLLAITNGVVQASHIDSASEVIRFYKDGVFEADSITGTLDLTTLNLADGIYAITAKAIPTFPLRYEESGFSNTVVYAKGELVEALPSAEGVSF